MDHHILHKPFLEQEIEYDLLFDLRIEELQEMMNEAFTILDHAQTTLFHKDDVLSNKMALKEFQSRMINMLKDML